ncbi:MAG: leucine-rich repeat domain-containing protein [Candidatus Thorarchaeota archaeon]
MTEKKIDKIQVCLVIAVFTPMGLVWWLMTEMISTVLSVRIVLTIGLLVGMPAFQLRLKNRPAKPKPPKTLVIDSNQTVLEAESFRLTEFHLDEIENIHRFTRINLGLNNLRRIDLTPLAGSDNLKELVLYMNHLETIDLTPLASCPNLEYLDLTSNDLETIDLTPLSSCLKLTGLNIGQNGTSHLNLSPISECKDLEVLNIDDMNLREIDLSPLRGFAKLWFLKLDDNDLVSLDITPLFECKSLTEFTLDRIELTTTMSRPIEEWPKGVRTHKKKFRKS